MRAARPSAASSSYRPKHVAPEPDMRTSRASGAAQQRQRLADRRGQLERGRLEVVAALRRGFEQRAARERPASMPSQRRKTSAVDNRDSRIDQQHAEARCAHDRIKPLAPAPAERGRAEQAGGHVRSQRAGNREQAGIIGRHAFEPGEARARSPRRRPSRRRGPRRRGATCPMRSTRARRRRSRQRPRRRGVTRLSPSPSSSRQNRPVTSNRGSGARSTWISSPCSTKANKVSISW